MCYEMDCLAELIDICSEINEFGRAEVQKLKAWVAEQGVTNLGMELNPGAN